MVVVNTTSLPHLCQLCLNIYWISATISIFLKSRISIFNNSLTYGKLTSLVPSSNSASWTKHVSIPTLGTAFAWRFFYFTGLSSCLLSHYNINNTLAIPNVLMLVQLVRRFLEACFVHKFSSIRRVSAIHFAAGTSFYIAAPFTIFLASNANPNIKTDCFTCSLIVS